MLDTFSKIFFFKATVCVITLFSTVQTSADSTAKNTLARYDYENDIFHPIRAKNGMVASEQEIASRVGLDILKRGGNAIDAAVGVGFALAVVLPNAGNIGGGGFLVLHDAKTGKQFALDFREIAPKTASTNMYLDTRGNVIPGRSTYSHVSVGVPGTVAGMEYALKKWGSLSLAEVLTPSIELAEKGFPVNYSLGKMLNIEQDNLGKWESTREIFFKNNKPLQEGDILVQKDLGHSLRLISQTGSQVFYNGEIGKKIISEIQQHNGIMTTEDLQDYKVIERKPLVGTYRGYEVITMPPPSSGGVHVIEMLNILENFPMETLGVNSAQSIHYLAETMKLAYADRSKYLGDPDFVKVPVNGLTSKHYAEILAKSISINKAKPSSVIQPNNPLPYESDQTTHFSVVDNKGNAVSVTYTLNLNFGTGIVAKGTGILLNNEMDDFSAKLGEANTFGLIGGKANAIEPKKRPLSSMTPTLVLKNNKPWLVTGSPGGSRIITSVLQTIVDMVDFKMNPAEAASTPRIHHQWLPDELRIEKGISADTVAILKNAGHNVVQKSTMGRTQTIQVLEDGLYGYSDPRNPNGATVGF
ncbi:gamma-glutamyltransferase [Acinetobacter baumannii]|nr:gamma-glutamyltransferase [Acinetobacter baumannii]